MQDELRKGRPYSIPGKIVSVRENGWSGFVWCPGKARRLLRNRRKMRLRQEDDDDDEDSDDAPDENEEMTDEEEIDLVDDESHDVLTVLASMPTATRATIHQVTADGTQLFSALRTVQTSPRTAQLTRRGEKIQLVRFSLECFHRTNLRAGDQLCPGLQTSTGQDYLCCCEQEKSAHKLCGGKFYHKYKLPVYIYFI